MTPQLRNNRVDILVGIPNVVHTFCDNVLFVDVHDDRVDVVSVDRKLKFILAPGDFLFCMEFFLSLGRVDRVVLGFWSAGSTARL